MKARKNNEKKSYDPKKLLSCNHCGQESSVEEVIQYALSNELGHNTTCPECGKSSAYYKMWLYPNGSRSVADPSTSIPFKAGLHGSMIPDRDSLFWPKNGDAILCIHPRECVPINGR